MTIMNMSIKQTTGNKEKGIIKKIMKNKIFSSTAKGFTLVELLIVIGILGILAAGLLATIDPLEQLKKGSDTNEKQTAVEFVDASTRYFADHSAWPWDNPTAGGG